MTLTYNQYLATEDGEQFYVGDIVTVKYYDRYGGTQTITGRLWFTNNNALSIVNKSTTASFSMEDVITMESEYA